MRRVRARRMRRTIDTWGDSSGSGGREEGWASHCGWRCGARRVEIPGGGRHLRRGTGHSQGGAMPEPRARACSRPPVIAIGGMDRAGKSLQRRLLMEYLAECGDEPIYRWSRVGYTRRLEG